MRPVYLEFCGINSFSERAEIDFTELLEFGIFGIFGDTGAGKSTILDCIGFALYGSVARARAGSAADIIHYKADKAYVRFEFEIVFEGCRRAFRVEREIKRKNALQAARVYEKKEGALLALAEGVRESNALLERIIGLEQRDFEKCIALPQGEFAQFVRSARSDRLKLISRLFDLERYGEGLVKRVNARYAEARSAWKIAETRMEPYLNASEEACGALAAEIARLAQEDASAAQALADAREREKRVSAASARRRELERAQAEWRRLEEEADGMETLRSELARLERAENALAAVRDGKVAKERSERAAEELAAAEKKIKGAEEALAALPAEDAEREDEELARLAERRAKAASAEQTREKLRVAAASLQTVERKLREEEGRCAEFPYGERRAELEARIAAAESGDFLSFAAACKTELLRGEYAVFYGELKALAAAKPIVAEDVAPLLEKYAALSEGNAAELGELVRAFRERERTLSAAREELLTLERQKAEQDVRLARLAALRAEKARAEEEIARDGALLSGVPALADAERELSEKKREKRERAEARKRAEEQRNASAEAYAAAQEKKRAAGESFAEAKKRYEEALRAGGFADAAEAGALVAKYGDAEGARARLEAYREKTAATKARIAQLSGEDHAATEEETAAAREALAQAEESALQSARTLALARAELVRAQEALEKRRALEKEYAAAGKRAELCERLKKLLEGNKFMEFVAEEYLQTVARNASGRLLNLTDGRYFLRYDGGFLVGDNFNGGAARGVYTLSGGETFLVSLSLALALSAEICAKSLRPIEFFFLDEGFGTLDERLADVVMDSLERLKGEHFSIGIISHVETLKHRIDRKITVKKATERHGSQIITE